MALPTTPSVVDLAAVIKDMWAKIGVDIELQIKEASVFSILFNTRNYDELFFSNYPGGTGGLFTRYGNSYYRGPNNYNLSYINDPEGTDPFITKTMEDIMKYVMVDYPKCDELMKALNQYCIDQAFLIPTPAPYVYRLWQPWMKNYYGEGATKFWLQYFWLDQGLKKSLGF
jgi:ABC-type transport system substrate-binding protein